MNNAGPKTGGSKQTLELYRRATQRYEQKILEEKKANGGKLKPIKMSKDPLFEKIVDEVIY